MAIRFDDRIETNVAGDVLITGEQISVSTNNNILEIGTNTSLKFEIGTEIIDFNLNTHDIATLNTIPNAISDAYVKIHHLASDVISPIVNKINSNNNNITINTTDKFFGDTLIASSADLENCILNISTYDNNGNPIKFPLITVLSAPIKINFNEGIAYSTKILDFPYGTDTLIPKNTLVCVTTSSGFTPWDFLYNNVHYNVFAISERIQVLSMPVSADNIHNNFETRIANIERLLALKQ